MPPKKGRGRGRGKERQESREPPPGEELLRRPPVGPRQQQQQPSAAAARPQEQQMYRPPGARHMQREGSSDVQQPRQHAPPPSEHRQQQLPSRESEARPAPPAAAESLVKSVASISLEPTTSYKGDFKMTKRPGYGKEGKPIALFANYFLLKFKNINIYHYDVDILFVRQRRREEAAAAATAPSGAMAAKGKSVLEEGRTAKEAAERGVSHVEHQMKRVSGKQRCRQVIAQMIQSKSLRSYNPVYDGQKNIYTTKPLPFTSKQIIPITLDEEDRYKDFEVVIQPVVKTTGGNIISIEPLRQLYEGRSTEVPQEVIMAFDTVMCHRDPPLTQVQVGRSFFLLNQRPYDLGEGLEIWYGYNQSVHLTERGPAVIVNFAAKAFHKSGSVIEYASEILGRDILKITMFQRNDIKSLSDSLSKLKVQVTHLHYPRKYAVKGVTEQPARDLRLNVDGKETTVAKYFQEKYRPLRYSYLPCLHMRGTNMTTYIPFEVCEIVPNQPKLGKLSPATTSKMIRQTAIAPENRFQEIDAEAQQINKSSGDIMKNFGLLMDLRFMQLQGRVLPSPALAYNQESREPVVHPVCGKWQMETGKQRFLRSNRSCSWILISFAGDRFCSYDKLEHFAETLCRTGRSVGMPLETVKEIQIFDRRTSTRQALKYVKDQKVTFAVVVLSPRDYTHSYEEVKFIADIQLRLVTQCMKDEVVVKRCNAQVAINVLLKLNSKIGGVNHMFYQKPMILSRPVIILGADAAHSPRGFACPSITAVVGSLDAFPSRYAVTCRTQTNPDEKKLSQEIILDLKEMVKYILERFKANTNGKYPEKIIFFRDGVSEGQFQIVLEKEIPMVQKACNEALGGNIPPLTFIVVQKRHQTRFRPQNPRDGVGKMRNVPPGTTVDTDVTHPVFFDFFLCSHEGIQGTSKPAHYTVLFDENNFGADELQKLCYHLCHMYVRCNRSISIPAPVMYADLACTRAKKYADLALSSDSQSRASSGSGGEQKLPQEVEDAINNMGNFEPGMFFV